MKSNMKIQCYKNKKINLLTLFLTLALLLVSILPSFHIIAFADESEQRVYDNANLLSRDEIESLESISLSIGAQYNTDIYIITDLDSDGKSRKTYIEDFADSKEVENSTVIFVNMESGNRGVEIQGYGDNEVLINNSIIESILDAVVPYLSNKEYYQAFTTFLQDTNYYLGQDASEYNNSNVYDSDYVNSDIHLQEELSNHNKSIFVELWFQAIISLVIGGIVVGIMAFNSGGRVTTNDRTYLDSNHSRINANRDDYIRTTTTKVRKPSPKNNGGGGFGGGISRGGRSHSGGGRSF